MAISYYTMYAPELHHFLSGILPAGNGENIQAILQGAEELSYAKNEVIFPKGKIPHRLLFIVSGNVIALSHSLPNQMAKRFYTSGQLICPEGVFNNKPSAHSIIALDHCRGFSLSYSRITNFASDNPFGYRLTNSILSEEISILQNRIDNFIEQTPMHRYQLFLSDYKQVPNLVKSELIASYLGISLSTLSRLKDQIR